jgi:hypothetical protein
MPAFATSTVADLEVSKRWYAAGLGFAMLAELPGAGPMRRTCLVPPNATVRHPAQRLVQAVDLPTVARL